MRPKPLIICSSFFNCSYLLGSDIVHQKLKARTLSCLSGWKSYAQFGQNQITTECSSSQQVKNDPNLVYRLPAPKKCLSVTPLYSLFAWNIGAENCLITLIDRKSLMLMRLEFLIRIRLQVNQWLLQNNWLSANQFDVWRIKTFYSKLSNKQGDPLIVFEKNFNPPRMTIFLSMYLFFSAPF